MCIYIYIFFFHCGLSATPTKIPTLLYYAGLYKTYGSTVNPYKNKSYPTLNVYYKNKWHCTLLKKQNGTGAMSSDASIVNLTPTPNPPPPLSLLRQVPPHPPHRLSSVATPFRSSESPIARFESSNACLFFFLSFINLHPPSHETFPRSNPLLKVRFNYITCCSCQATRGYKTLPARAVLSGAITKYGADRTAR